MKLRSGPRYDPQAPVCDPEAALVARVAAREQTAFAELYGIYRRRLARFLSRFLASPDTIAKVMSRAWMWSRWLIWSATNEQPTQPFSGQPSTFGPNM